MNQAPATKAPVKKRRTRYTKTPLRKSVLLNVVAVFIPGMLVWWLLGHDTPLRLADIGFFANLGIAIGLFLAALTMAVVCTITKFTEPDQVLYSTTLMAVLMSFYLTSFSSYSVIIQVLMAVAVLLVVAFLTNGVANVWADNLQRKLAIAKLKKLNLRLQNKTELPPEKIDQQWINFLGIKYDGSDEDKSTKVNKEDKSTKNNKTTKSKTDDTLINDQKSLPLTNEDSSDKKLSQTAELEALREIKLEDEK